MAAKKKAAKKNGNGAIKFDATKGDVAAHIEKDVNAVFANAKNTWTIMRGYVELNAAGKLPANRAKELLVARRNALQAKYAAAHDTRTLGKVEASRISEMAGILRLGEWKCWPTAFTAIKDLDVNIDTVNTLSKIVRKSVKGEAKQSADSCPPREAIIAEIKRRKAQRRGKGGTANGNTPLTASQAEVAIERMQKAMKRLARWFGSDGKQLVTAAKRNIDTLAATAKKLAKERAKEEAAEAAA